MATETATTTTATTRQRWQQWWRWMRMTMKKDSGRQWRVLQPSPPPLSSSQEWAGRWAMIFFSKLWFLRQSYAPSVCTGLLWRYWTWLRSNSNHGYCQKRVTVTGILSIPEITAVISNLGIHPCCDVLLYWIQVMFSRTTMWLWGIFSLRLIMVLVFV